MVRLSSASHCILSWKSLRALPTGTGDHGRAEQGQSRPDRSVRAAARLPAPASPASSLDGPAAAPLGQGSVPGGLAFRSARSRVACPPGAQPKGLSLTASQVRGGEARARGAGFVQNCHCPTLSTDQTRPHGTNIQDQSPGTPCESQLLTRPGPGLPEAPALCRAAGPATGTGAERTPP